MAELENESEIHNGSILFLSTDKQDISPAHPNTLFKSLSLMSHKNKLEQRREQTCTTKDLLEGIGEFELVRLASPEDRRLTRPFNDKASHTKKMDKSNNNDKMPASCKNSSHETPVEQEISVSDYSSRANFPNPLMSVNNVSNCDAHSWPKNTILIAGDFMINGTNEKHFSTNFKSVEVRYFSGATIDDMYFNLIPAALVLHLVF